MAPYLLRKPATRLRYFLSLEFAWLVLLVRRAGVPVALCNATRMRRCAMRLSPCKKCRIYHSGQKDWTSEPTFSTYIFLCSKTMCRPPIQNRGSATNRWHRQFIVDAEVWHLINFFFEKKLRNGEILKYTSSRDMCSIHWETRASHLPTPINFLSLHPSCVVTGSCIDFPHHPNVVGFHKMRSLFQIWILF